MLESVLETINRYNMLSRFDRVVVGVSGGPDSIALLHFLFSQREKYSLYIHAAHLNHMLRGEESEADTEYVRKFCSTLGIPCTISYCDIESESAKWGLSSEEAGRRARYQLFSRVADEVKAGKIALAHNMNDQAETVLMRIMRGTGLDGLEGIRPVRDGIYIRPLIHTSRREIEEYCSANSLSPRIDSTNLMPIYSRNKVRLELIPYIKESFNPNIEYSLSSMAALLAEDKDFIDSLASSAYTKAARDMDSGVSLDGACLKELHASIKKRVIRKAVERVRGSLTGIESRHINLILSILEEGGTGAASSLPGGIRVYMSYGNLNIIRAADRTEVKFDHPMTVPGITCIPEISAHLESAVFDSGETDIRGERFVKYFDFDKIKGNLYVRSRREGDTIVPLGLKGRQKIKELFIDCKIPRDERDRIPIVHDDKEILWAAGYKMSDIYRIDSNTKKILKLELRKTRGNSNA